MKQIRFCKQEKRGFAAIKLKRLLLMLFLIGVGAQNVWAQEEIDETPLEQVTEANGVTYQIYFTESILGDKYAKAISAVTSSSVSELEIPNTVHGTFSGDVPVVGFDKTFTCNCPNVRKLIIKNSTQDGVINGDLSGFYKYLDIYFHDPSEESAATGRTWILGPDAIIPILQQVTVHLSEVRKVHKSHNSAGYYFYYDEATTDSWRWQTSGRIECSYQYINNGIGVLPTDGLTYSEIKGAVVYIDPSLTAATVPAYSGKWSDFFLPNYSNYGLSSGDGQWKITRLGYPVVKTKLKCDKLTTLTFEADITIDEGVDFSSCYSLKKMVFNGDADVSNMNFNAYIEQLEFHGKASLPLFSSGHMANLKKVYFYGPIPKYPGALQSLDNLTVYVDMDKFDIEDWKAANPNWESVNIQPINPNLNYSMVTVNNPNEGTFKVRKQFNGDVTWETIKPNTTRSIKVDKGAKICATDFSIPESSQYRLVGFVFNDTIRLNESNLTTVTADKNTFTACYRQLICQEGTELDIHFTKVGDGEMWFREYDENQWALIDSDNDEWLELHDMNHDGEEYNYTITFHDGMDLVIAFSCFYNKPVDGITEQCLVLVNGVPEPIETWQLTEDDYGFCADYTVPIDGDMNIQIIHQNNGRKLSVVNGDGGTIALYREGETEPVGTIYNGTSYEKMLPKDIAHYAVITPVNGKEVFALFVNKPLSETARLQLDASQYLQEDGTYRVPLSGFADSKDTYRLTVLYVDRPSYSFNLAVVGDGSLKCIPFREEDGDSHAIREVTVSEANGRNQTAKAFYDEIGETGYVEFWLTAPKEGEIVKVYMDGVDVSNKFKPKENMDNQLCGVIASMPDVDNLGVLSSLSLLAVYEENKDVVRWKAQMIGEVGNSAFNMSGHDLHFALNADNPSDTFVDSDTEDPTITSGAVFNGVLTVPTGYTFNVLFNGQNLSSHFEYENTENGLDSYYAEIECTGTELSKLLTNGFWTIEIMKKKITWTAKVTGAINERTSTQFLINGGDVLDMDFNGLETTQETATFNPVDIYASDWSVSIVVKQGQKVRFLFNGDDVTKQVKMNDNYPDDRVSFSLNESTSTLSQFLVDGLWVFEIDRPDIIEFADEEVKRICVENWDTDGDHELSKAEAAAVTTLKKDNGDGTFGDPVFKENSVITSFDELQYFTGLTTIDEYAFHTCTALASVKLPDGVKTLHNYSFKNCSSLQHIQLPEGLDKLNTEVFANTGLTSIFIPKSVTSVSEDAFVGCAQLQSIVIEDGPSKYSSPNGCNAVIYNRAIIMLQSGCRNTVIPDNVVMISQKAFKGQTELTKIVIPSSVSIINQEAFYGCSNLTSVVVERETPATLGTSAFGGISADCILTVPAGCAEAYADWAQYFKEIVEEPAREDLNNDGQVNIADVTKLVNKVVGKE